MSHFLSTYLSDFVARFDGPLHFRLIAQPLMAVLFAVRDGLRDAREGQGAYFWSVLTDADHRRYLIKDGWKGISKIFVMAYLLDVVYQLIEWHRLKPLEALLTAIILAVIPYTLLRGPVNRLVRAWHRRLPASTPR
jgi:hypothetical protein